LIVVMMGRKPRVSGGDFVAAALEYVRTTGLDALTTRSLGAAMGVDSTAIYRHFPDKDHLLVAVRDDLHRQINEQADVTDLAPREAIAVIARTTRRVYGEHPELSSLHTTLHGSLPHTAACIRSVISQMEEIGLVGRDLVVAYQMFEGAVIGTLVFENSGAPENWAMRKDRYTYIGPAAFAEAGRSEDEVRRVAEQAFEMVLEVVLDRIEQLAAGQGEARAS